MKQETGNTKRKGREAAMPSDPVSAGRKGGKSKSEKKIAACKRNGFQKQQPAPAPVAPAAPRPLFVPTKEQS